MVGTDGFQVVVFCGEIDSGQAQIDGGVEVLVDGMFYEETGAESEKIQFQFPNSGSIQDTDRVAEGLLLMRKDCPPGGSSLSAGLGKAEPNQC